MQNTLHNTVSEELYVDDDQYISLIGEDVFYSISDNSITNQDSTQNNSSISSQRSISDIIQADNFISFNGRKMDH